jgi:hypothetical protein
MAFDINWNLLTDSSARLGNAIGEAGKSFAVARKRKALSNYLANPDDEDAAQQLLDRDPDLYVKARSAARDEQTRRAQSDYIISRYGSPAADKPVNNSLVGATASPGASGEITLPSPLNGVTLPSGPMSAANSQPDAFTRLAKADAATAMKMRIDALKFDSDRLELADKVNAAQLKLLATAKDQASWEMAKSRARQQLRQFGLDTDSLDAPGQFDPDWVETQRLNAMEADKYFAELRGRKRLEWDISDDKLDNARADRETDDRIYDRGQRRNLIARGQNMDSADRRRGQNMIDARSRADDSRPTPSKVIGQILHKIATGQKLTPAEADAFNTYKSIDAVDRGIGLGATASLPTPTTMPLPQAPPQPRPVTAATGPAVGQTATNRQTGAKVRWNGARWEPVR